MGENKKENLLKKLKGAQDEVAFLTTQIENRQVEIKMLNTLIKQINKEIVDYDANRTKK